MTTEPNVISMPAEVFDDIYSKLMTLEAMADVAATEPEGLAIGTAQHCRAAVYFGIGEVKELLGSVTKGQQ